MNKQSLNPKFYDLFDGTELEQILNDACAISADCICIATKEWFFELSADQGGELEIYGDRYKNGTDRTFSKERFMALYILEELMGCVRIGINI